MDNQFSVDTNNCFSPLAAWVGYGDKQDLGIVTFIVYGLEEREKEGLRISTILRNFVYDYFGFEEDDLYIIYTRRIGQSDKMGRRVSKIHILCTCSHDSEVDVVTNEVKRLKKTFIR